jgi:molybdenum cofactor cytidylyltransferase
VEIVSKIAAVILAAGGSSRLGRPKQLIQFRGKSLVGRVVEAAKDAGCTPVVVVLGSDRERIEAELKERAVTIVKNENWQNGIGTSIRAGVGCLIDSAPEIEAVVLLTSDQPFVSARTIEQLIALRKKTKKAIVASSYSDTLGVPALFDRSCFRELLALDDASGAKSIIFFSLERVAEFSFPDGRIDIDREEDWEKLADS